MKSTITFSLYLIFLEFEGVWNIMRNEVPVFIANLTKQLLHTDLVTMIVNKLHKLTVHFPTVYKAVLDLWTDHMVPAYMDLVTLFKKVMKIQFTSRFERIYC